MLQITKPQEAPVRIFHGCAPVVLHGIDFRDRNIQRPTSDFQLPMVGGAGGSGLGVPRCWMFDVRCSMLDVRCWMFDVFGWAELALGGGMQKRAFWTSTARGRFSLRPK